MARPLTDLDDCAEQLVRSTDSRNTAQTHRTAYRAFCAHIGPDRPRSILTPTVLADWKDALERNGKSPATIAVYLSTLRSIATIAGSDPTIRSRSLRPAAHARRPLDDHEVTRLLQAPDPTTRIGIRDLSLLRLQIYSGIRATEIPRLRLEDLQTVARHRQEAVMSRCIARVADQAGRRRDSVIDSATASLLAGWLTVRPTSASPALFLTLPAVSGRHPKPLQSRDPCPATSRRPASYIARATSVTATGGKSPEC